MNPCVPILTAQLKEGERLSHGSRRFIQQNLGMDKVVLILAGCAVVPMCTCQVYGYIVRLMQDYAALLQFKPER